MSFMSLSHQRGEKKKKKFRKQFSNFQFFILWMEIWTDKCCEWMSSLSFYKYGEVKSAALKVLNTLKNNTRAVWLSHNLTASNLSATCRSGSKVQRCTWQTSKSPDVLDIDVASTDAFGETFGTARNLSHEPDAAPLDFFCLLVFILHQAAPDGLVTADQKGDCTHLNTRWRSPPWPWPRACPGKRDDTAGSRPPLCCVGRRTPIPRVRPPSTRWHDRCTYIWWGKHWTAL